MTKAAQTVTRVAQPQYETVSERVMVKPASVRYEPVPAVYETVTEQVLVKEASTRIITIPGEYETVHNSRLYTGGTSGLSADAGDILDPNNPNSPNNGNSIFNPAKPGSLANMSNPNNPYNPDSPYYGRNISQSASARSGGAGGGVDDGFISEAMAGYIMPYIEEEAGINIDKVPANYTTETETMVVSPATTKWVKRRADRNCLSANPDDCLVWCLVEVPEQTRTITKTVLEGCPQGYYQSDTRDSRDRVECIKVSWKPARYGVRTVMTKAPEYRTETIPAEYQTITKRVLT
ncbi:MAG: hypothetical protein HKN08_07425, partial [Gammaproteobacteria bacterium]|nr:hypothetical protein [Gammaproteobacteria bacterium]